MVQSRGTLQGCMWREIVGNRLQLWEEELGETMWRVRQEQTKLEKEWCMGVGGLQSLSQSNAFLTIFKNYMLICQFIGFLGGSVVKNPLANAGDTGSIPWSGRSPGGGNGNPLQYSCLRNPRNRRAWWARVHGVTKSLMGLNWAWTHVRW